MLLDQVLLMHAQVKSIGSGAAHQAPLVFQLHLYLKGDDQAIIIHAAVTIRLNNSSDRSASEVYLKTSADAECDDQIVNAYGHQQTDHSNIEDIHWLPVWFWGYIPNAMF